MTETEPIPCTNDRPRHELWAEKVTEYQILMGSKPWSQFTKEDQETMSKLVEEINELTDNPEVVAQNSKTLDRILRLMAKGWDHDPQRILNGMFRRKLGGGYELR